MGNIQIITDDDVTNTKLVELSNRPMTDVGKVNKKPAKSSDRPQKPGPQSPDPEEKIKTNAKC